MQLAGHVFRLFQFSDKFTAWDRIQEAKGDQDRTVLWPSRAYSDTNELHFTRVIFHEAMLNRSREVVVSGGYS